jgi:uncharacterized protein (DUF2252 family)
MPTRDERRAAGEAARRTLPLAGLAAFTAAPDRPDPVDLIESQAATRIPSLVPIRHGRMAESPFAYYRGAALPMAADLAGAPTTGIITQLCGDAHLSNFGLFASPERTLVFDVNDFDETLPGPFEWDVKRLAASVVVAGRSRSFDEHTCRHAVHRMGQVYRSRMAEYAAMRAIDVYYAHVDAEGVQAFVGRRARPFLEQTAHAASRHEALHELPKLTEVDAEGKRRIVDRPPTISHPAEVTPELVEAAMSDYRSSLQEDRRVLLDRYELVDVALKVVGVGSVGLAALAVLFLGDDDDDPLFLQFKEAEPSVLERYLGESPQPSHGARVVAGQRRLQAASDILLGWAVGKRGRHWYVRQLQDQKGSAVVDAMTIDDLGAWAELCGWALARGHARSGRPAEIAGYLGTEKTFEHAIAEFAIAYADQNERDHAAFVEAIRQGRIPAESGV